MTRRSGRRIRPVKTTPTHAGSVAFRQDRGRKLFLVAASSDGAHWVLPKGHIQPGESPEEAALRELEEETGAIGEIVARLSVRRFKTPLEEVVVRYFLVKTLRSVKAREKRALRWEDEETALEILSFENTRGALREGAAAARDVPDLQAPGWPT